MKRQIFYIILATVLLGVCVFEAEAQTRPQKTSSARAYYGQAQGRPKVNVNRKKKARERAAPTTRAIRANAKRRYS